MEKSHEEYYDYDLNMTVERSIAVGQPYNAFDNFGMGCDKPVLYTNRDKSGDLGKGRRSLSIGDDKKLDIPLPVFERRAGNISTSVTLNAPKDEVINFVSKYLSVNNIYFEYENGFWKCKHAVHLDSVVIHIQLFETMTSQTKTIVEFLRYSGSCQLFYEIYNSFSKLNVNTTVPKCTLQCCKHDNVMSCLSLSDDDSGHLSPLTTEEQLESLKALLNWLELDPIEAFSAIVTIALEQSHVATKISMLDRICQTLIAKQCCEQLLIVINVMLELLHDDSGEADEDMREDYYEAHMTIDTVYEQKQGLITILKSLYPRIVECSRLSYSNNNKSSSEKRPTSNNYLLSPVSGSGSGGHHHYSSSTGGSGNSGNVLGKESLLLGGGKDNREGFMTNYVANRANMILEQLKPILV